MEVAVAEDTDLKESVTEFADRTGALVAVNGGYFRSVPNHWFTLATVFNLYRKGRWRLETNGSSEALERLLAGEAQAAVLWEPDVSRALAQPDMIKLIGSGPGRTSCS